MSIVYPIRGEFWPQDSWGRIQNNACERDELNEKWASIGEEAVDAALLRFDKDLHSVYLCGPAARNRPGGGSIIVILGLGAAKHNTDNWANLTANSLRLMNDCKFGIKIHVCQWRDVFPDNESFSPVAFRIATNSICFGGRSVSRLIRAPRLEEAVANTMLVSMEKRLQNEKRRTLASDSRQSVRTVSATIGHAIVSAGYATIMQNEQVYSEDLDIRRDLFQLNYPELDEKIQEAYDMAALPSCDPVQVRRFINEASEWIKPIVDDWLNTYTPDRLELLNT